MFVRRFVLFRGLDVGRTAPWGTEEYHVDTASRSWWEGPLGLDKREEVAEDEFYTVGYAVYAGIMSCEGDADWGVINSYD